MIMMMNIIISSSSSSCRISYDYSFTVVRVFGLLKKNYSENHNPRLSKLLYLALSSYSY